ncbi:hypothetical protein NUW58_g10835 [Xylaria curta]|uniref:Uncharacterized protein n=1 Tax=Xylaria curta TaxID=42375 RepID=A0ACC1MGE4_9PEZI|nr:hypothetical protein NUW58_g10835 [Xylaria curta]
MLKQLGIAGILTKKAEGYKDILQDVFEELKEWSELDSEEDHNDEPAYDSSDGSQDPQASAQQMIDDLMTPSHIPLDDPHRIRERLDSSLKRLRLTTLLFSAIIKRRIKTLPPLLSNQATPIAQRLDEVYPILERLPDHFNELTTAFYELDPAGIDRTMDLCFFDAFAAAEMLKAPWTGTEDAFTEWVDKFQLSIKKHDEKTATVP